MMVQPSSGARRRSASGAPISSGQTTFSQAGPANGVLITFADHTATAVSTTPITTRIRSSTWARPAAFMPTKVRPHGLSRIARVATSIHPRGGADSPLRPLTGGQAGG